MQRTTALIAHITALDPALGAWLADQARNLCYEPILRLLDGATAHPADPLP